MAQLPKRAKAATPILRVLLQTWCTVVIYSAGNDSIEEISVKLDLEKKTLERWRAGENIATYKHLKGASGHALEKKLISKELNQLILDVYEDFFVYSNDRLDYWKIIQVVNSFDKFILNQGAPQPLVKQLDDLGYLVYGPGQNSSEFDSWLDIYKPLYLACEEENLNEYIEILAEREFVEHKERYSSRSLDPGYETSDNDLKKFIDTLESEREEIKKTIKDDIVHLMARIAEKTNHEYTSGLIAIFAGQHYSMGKFLADGEIIPNPSVYRILEFMAGSYLDQVLGKKCSPFSLGRLPAFRVLIWRIICSWLKYQHKEIKKFNVKQAIPAP